MAIRSHKLELLVLDHHQETVEVIADVLLRHGVLHKAKQPAQSFLAQRKAGDLTGRLRKARKVLRGKRLQRESTLARLDQQTLILLLERDFCAVGKGTQYIDKLSRANRHCLCISIRLRTAARLDLDFDIGGEEQQRLRTALNQHVRQDRQRMAALDDAAHRRKRAEEFVAL